MQCLETKLTIISILLMPWHSASCILSVHHFNVLNEVLAIKKIAGPIRREPKSDLREASRMMRAQEKGAIKTVAIVTGSLQQGFDRY